MFSYPKNSAVLRRKNEKAAIEIFISPSNSFEGALKREHVYFVCPSSLRFVNKLWKLKTLLIQTR